MNKYIQQLFKYILLLFISVILTLIFIVVIPNKLLLQNLWIDYKCINNQEISSKELYPLIFNYPYFPEVWGYQKNNWNINENISIKKNNDFPIIVIGEQEIIITKTMILIIQDDKVVEKFNCNKKNIIIGFHNGIGTYLNFNNNTTNQNNLERKE